MVLKHIEHHAGSLAVCMAHTDKQCYNFYANNVFRGHRVVRDLPIVGQVSKN